MTNGPLDSPNYSIPGSPAYRAIWDDVAARELFEPSSDDVSACVRRVIDDSLAAVQLHLSRGTLLNGHQKIAEEVLHDLGQIGFWGLRIDNAYGGSGARWTEFYSGLTTMAVLQPAIAGMAGVHSCLGPVNSVQAFGDCDQRDEWLPRLARGEPLGAFALTEPAAGSDVRAIRTHAVRHGGEYVISGQKVFITNGAPGRALGLVCMLDETPSLLVCELPQKQNESFQLETYGLWSLKHTPNHGLCLRDFRIPAQNRLQPVRGNGLTIAYYNLNRGRVALCAHAAGTMRRILSGLLPWIRFRKTCGASLQTRPLIRRRLGRLAALIVGCDAITGWCAKLLDLGYRGELEGIIAKVFASESLKEAAIDIGIRTHGGRSFLVGHPLGDDVYDYLAPCIYEGENELLSLAFFRSLLKPHETANLVAPTAPAVTTNFDAYAEFAIEQLRHSRAEIESLRQTYRNELWEQQCQIHAISSRIQKQIVLLCISHYGARQDRDIVRAAAEVLCRDLRRELSGERPSDQDWQMIDRLGTAILDGGFPGVPEGPIESILMRYD